MKHLKRQLYNDKNERKMMRMIFIIIITIIIIINIIIIIIIALSSLLLLNCGLTTTRFGSSQTTLRATQLL